MRSRSRPHSNHEPSAQGGQAPAGERGPALATVAAPAWWLGRRTAWTVLLIALAVAGLVLFFGQRGYDDAYITFRYADNLLRGNGLVYNAGERVLSTTTPLYALLLAGVGLLWRDLAAAGSTLSAVALALGAALLAKLAWDNGQRAVGLLAAVLLVLSGLLISTFGGESCLYVALVLAGLVAYDRSRPAWAAAALAAAAMARPDGVLAAGVLAVYHLARRRPVPWRAVALYAGLLGAWYGALALYFGSPLPVTLLAKQQQGQMPISQRFAPGLFALAGYYVRLPLGWLHALLVLVGLGRVVARDRYWVPLLAWTVVYFLAYTLLGVSRYFWYYAPLVPAYVVLVAEGAVTSIRFVWRAASGARPARREPLRLAATILTGALLIGLLLSAVVDAAGAGWQADSRLEVYRQAGEWLAAHTPPDASLGTLEIGVIGYHARRPMVDFAGLLQPEVARHLTVDGDYVQTAAWTIQTYQPSYVLLHRPAFDTIVASDWFTDTYRPVRDFHNDSTLWLMLYRRAAGQ